VIIIRLVRFKPERWRIGVDSTAGYVNFASNAPRPSELHSVLRAVQEPLRWQCGKEDGE
jgi:hypothetical protein